MDEKYLQDFYNRIVNRDPSYKEKMPFETFKVKMQDEAYNTKMQNWLGTSAPPQNAGVDIDAFLGKEPVKKKEPSVSLQRLPEVEPTLASSSEDVSSASSSQSKNYYQQLGNLTQGTSSDATAVVPKPVKNIGPSDILSQSLSQINQDVLNNSEEKVITELSKDKTLKNLGFTFEETGAGDYMIVTAPDKKTTIEISLNSPAHKKSPEQSLKLKKFINEHTNTKKLAELEEDSQISKRISQTEESDKEKFEQEFEQGAGNTFDKNNNKYLNDRLKTITPDLITKNEEFVVPKLNYQFGDLGFTFEETGVGDYMIVTAPDKKTTTKISLDPSEEARLVNQKAVSESKKLQQFIKDNATEKGLYVIEKSANELNKKIDSQKDIDASIKKIADEANGLNVSLKSFLDKKSSFDKMPSGTENYNKIQAELIAERDELLKKQENLKTKEVLLNKSVGKYTEMKAQQGSYFEGTWNALLDSFASVSAGIADVGIDVMSELMPNEMQMSPSQLKEESFEISKKLGIAPPTEKQTFVQWKATLTEDQQDDVEDKLDDITKKSAKKDLIPLVRQGNRELFGSSNATPEWEQLKSESFWGGAYFGLVKTVPALIGGAGVTGWAQRTANMYAMVSDGIRKEMDANPDFDNVSENEKLGVVLPIGITSAVFEEFGLMNIKGSTGVINRIAMSALGKSGMRTTAKTFRELVENEVESALAKGLLTIGSAGLAEFESGAAQEFTETGIKAIYNQVQGKKMFETPETIGQWVNNILIAGAQEAVGGFVLGMPTAVSAAYSQKGFLKMDDQTFKMFESAANDENIQKAFITKLKTQITQGVITTAEGKEQLNNYRNSVGLFRSLTEGLNTQQKKEAMNLLKEKRDLENQVDGKDSSLSAKLKERIAAIDASLVEISEVANNEKVIAETNKKEFDALPDEEKTKLKESISNNVRQIYGDVLFLNLDDDEITELALRQFVSQKNKGKRIAEIEAILSPDAETQVSDRQKNKLKKELDTLVAKPNTEGLMPIEEIFENADSESLKNKESTAKALESLAADKTEGSTFTDNEGNALPVVGNENTLAELYHEAVDTPMEQRTEAQNSAMDVVKKSLNEKVKLEKIFVEDTAPTQDDSRSASNKSDMGDMKGRVKGQAKVKVIESAQRAIKTLKSILPNFDIHIHEDEGSYNAAMQKVKGQAGSKGNFYNKGDGTGRIDINLSRASATTVAHEVAHGVMLKVFGDNPALFKKFRENISKVLKDDKNKALNEFADRYGDDVQHEEYLVQLTAILEQEQDSISTTTVQKIAAIINKVLSTISGGKIVAFQDITDTKELIEFLNKVSGSIREGGDINIKESSKGLQNETSKSQKGAIKIIEGKKESTKKAIPAAKYLNKLTESKLSPESESGVLIERFLNNIYEEAGFFLGRSRDAREAGMTWYSEDMTEFKQKIQILIPELKDENKYKLFLTILAITSSGTNPNQNLQYAYVIWKNSDNPSEFEFSKDWGDIKMSFFKASKNAWTAPKSAGNGVIVSEDENVYNIQLVDALGRLEYYKNGKPRLKTIVKKDMGKEPKSTGYTNRGKIVKAQLNKLQELRKDLGSLEKVLEWLQSPHSIAELRKNNLYVPDINGNSAGVTNKVYDPSKNAVGERAGAFIFGEKIGSFYQNMIGIGETITMDLWWSRTWNRYMGTMLYTAPAVEAAEATAVTPAIKASGKKVQIQDVPRNDRERNIMREAVTIAATELGLEVSELQAVIWYFEQSLWTKAGNRSPSYSYVTAIDSLTDKETLDETTRKQIKSATVDISAANKRRENAINRATTLSAEKSSRESGERPTDGQSKSQLDNKKEAPKFVRDISALITPATVRGFNPLTKRIKKLSLKYDDLVKQYAKNKDPKILAKIKTAEAQILNDAKQEIVDAIAKVDGVSVQFKDAKRGLWENKFEPSFNMNLSISPQADTKKISDLLFDFATKYSQDAFILETESEFEEDVFSGKREIPLTEFDKNDLMHYPQIIYTFDTPITDEQVADLSVALEKEGVSAFSINNNAVQVSVIKFLSPEEEANLTKDKQYEERKRDLDSKSIATAKATYDVLGSNGKGTSSIRIKKSSYQGAINEKSADQTRQFDRSDVLKAFKESTTKIEKLAVELANLRQKEINLKKEGKELSVKGKAKFDKLVKQIQPVIQRTFETNKKLYEDSKIEVEGIAQDAIEQVDASISPFPIKRAERASVKTIRWYNSFTERLGDGARVNIVTDTDVDADKVFEIIDKKYPVDKELRRISETTDLGYPKRLIEIRTSNGVIAEIQVITNEAYLAKDGVKGFTGDKKQKATAKQKLDGVRSRLGWSIPDGLGHYFYEIQRDTNVDENLRDEAARLSDIYYDAFTNPKSKLKESFMKDVMSFKEQVDAADKSKWDVGNIGKAPESITEGTSKSQKGDEKRDVEIENILNPKHKGFGKRMELAEKKKIGTSQTFKEDKNVNYVFRNTTKEEVDNVLSGKEKTGDFWRSEPNEYKNYGDYVIIKKAPNLKEYSRNYSKGNKIENDGFNYVGEKVGKEDIDFIYNKKTGEIIYNNNPELVNAVEQSLPTQETEGSSKSQLTEKNISEMVKKARAEGLSDEAIRKRLLNNGISSSDIDIAMESTETSSSKIEVNEQRMPGYDAMLSKVRGIREKSAARGRSENDTNNSVMAYVMGSDVYKNASDIQREAIVRQIRKYFGLREKSAPKVTNLLDGDMVTVSSKVLVLEKIKALVRGGKDAVKAIKAAQEQLRKEIKELRKSGKITVAQLERVMGRLGKTDLLSPTATARFIDYMGKVFADAEYGQKISDAYKTRSQILSLTKNKDKNVDLKTLGVEFAKIDPSMVEDIDAYNDMAKSIEEAIRGSTIKKGNPKFAASVRISSAMEYVKATLETQERLITEERIAEIQELMGIDATGFSAREMIDLLKSPAPLTKYNEPNIRALVSRAFDAYKSIIEQELKSGIDAFTGEPVYYTAAERKAIREFMEMDTDKMPTAKEGLDAVDSLINFLANKSTAKMMSVTAKYNGQQNAKKVVAKKIESVKLKKLFMPGLARTLAEQTTNLNIVFEKMFKGFNRSRIVMEAMGLLDFINRKAYAQNKSKIIVSDYIKTFYKKGVRPNGQAFNTAYNEAERGMAAFMMRNVIGTPEQRAIEFDRRKRLIQQSIDALRTGNEKEQKKSKIYEEAYNKVLADAEGINDIIANTDKINLDAIDYWHKQWNANFEQMASTSIGIYNKILERESNYSPDRFSKLSEFAVEQIKLDEETSAFHTNNGTLYKRAAGSLQKAERPSNLGEFNEDGDMSKVKHYIDLSFDRNNSNSMYDALVDIETAASIRQVQAFMNSDDFRKIVPYSEDRALLTNRINLYIRKSRGKESYSDDELSKFMRVLNKVSTIGVGQALGGVTQPAKQVIPIAFNTIINGGGLNVVSVFDKDFSTWLESLGMPISNRGIQSQTEVDNINAKIQEAADSKGEQLLNLIESANKQWLKIFLVAPDVFIARASWKGYYEKALAKQGIDIKGLDYSTHEVNMEAANYAQGMVDRQQNISDHDMSGKAFVSTEVAPQILVKSLMAFASFRMNAASRTAADLSTIGHWSVSTKEDKATALKSLAGYAVEQAVFKSITVGISLAIGSLALSVMGKDEDDDEFEKRKNNLIKGAATGAVTDIISPVPVTDKVMQELAAWTLDQTQSLVGVSDEDKLSLFGTIKEGFLKGAGTFGIALEKASQLIDLVDLSYSGTYIDDYGKEKKITEKDREALSMFILPAIMTNIGLAPSEVSSLVRNAVKSSKKVYKTDAERAEAEQKDREEAKENREKINALVELKSKTSSSAEIDYINKKIRELNLEGEEKKEFKKAKEEENKIKNAKKELLLEGFENQSDMKKYAPEKWERNFGEGSEWYRENNAEMKVNKNLRKEEKEEKEDLYNYVEPSKSKKKSTGWGTVTKKKSTGWGSANKKKNKGWGSK